MDAKHRSMAFFGTDLPHIIVTGGQTESAARRLGWAASSVKAAAR